jgi:anti-sigma B factor antagonist
MAKWDVDFDRSQEAGTRVLAATGEIDLASAGRFAQELAALVADGTGTALVDLSGVSFLDSSGVRELLSANRQAKAMGMQLQLVNPSAACRRVLEISGVWDEFMVQRTETQ